ncbi:NADH:ubiquinone oxidoreductase subunit A [candidate division GN15 bacterium]|nr:NADH:ubiquinone oxidoreductase subunit A [candidate division GN15 bacterium]
MTSDVFPLLVYTIGALVILGAMYLLSWLLGQRHQDRETNLPYESGITSTGGARVRFSAQFYLVAMLFVIFDLEVVFLFAWAVAGKDLGWPGYLAMLIFAGILTAGLIYEWRMGALDFLRKPARRGSR